MKNKKETEVDSQKMTNFLLTFLNGFIQKISVGLVLNAKKQAEEVIFRIKRGVTAGFFIIFGIFFLLIGLAIYLESILGFVSGGGYFVVGTVSVLMAFLIGIIKR
ncbi:MAG: hypothetical protein KAQ63_00465 [Candidatus Moranbacteria bacterium]|nr:hypothetical protein [Candidatus Moranbacteria bacterium]